MHNPERVKLDIILYHSL